MRDLQWRPATATRENWRWVDGSLPTQPRAGVCPLFFFPLKSSPSRWSASDFEAKFGRGSCAPSGRIPKKSFDGTLIHLFAKWTSCSVLHSSAYSEHSQRCAFFKRIFMELGRSIQKLTSLTAASVTDFRPSLRRNKRPDRTEILKISWTFPWSPKCVDRPIDSSL